MPFTLGTIFSPHYFLRIAHVSLQQFNDMQFLKPVLDPKSSLVEQCVWVQGGLLVNI